MGVSTWVMRMSLYAFFTILEKSPSDAKSYLQTNEVTYRGDERELLRAPMCTPDSICGYLHANVRGINYQRLCACPSGFSSCPMNWDSDDGHSVTQGSDQYKVIISCYVFSGLGFAVVVNKYKTLAQLGKFCGRPPSLTTCDSTQAAYSTRMEYSKSTDELYSKIDRLHCVCPADHNYVLAHQNWGEADPDLEAVEFSYTCIPLPVCGVGDTCKTISEKGSEFLVNRKCQCPDGLRCPTIAKHGIKSYDMGAGRVDMVRCQR